MNNNIKISLTISLEGSTLVRKNKSIHIEKFLTDRELNPYKKWRGKDGLNKGLIVDTYHYPLEAKPASQSINMTQDAYDYFISSDSCPHHIKMMAWKQMSKTKRLETHLNETAEFLGGKLLEYKVFDD